MKKNLNVIQIKGVKGIIVAVIVVCCLIAGFIAFPGLVGMYLWNYLASYLIAIPQIGLFQGILLWAIILTSYSPTKVSLKLKVLFSSVSISSPLNF